MINFDKYGLTQSGKDVIAYQSDKPSDLLLKCILQELQELNSETKVKEKVSVEEETPKILEYKSLRNKAFDLAKEVNVKLPQSQSRKNLELFIEENS